MAYKLYRHKKEIIAYDRERKDVKLVKLVDPPNKAETLFIVLEMVQAEEEAKAKAEKEAAAKKSAASENSKK